MTPPGSTRARGFFGLGIWHPKVEENIGTLWRSAHAFEASFLFTVGKRYVKQPTDTARTPLSVPLFHYVDLEDLIAHLPRGCALVGVEAAARAVDLSTFKHPDQAAYLLGAEGAGLPDEVMDRCAAVIQIETRQCLNVAVAGSIVMYDRCTRSRGRSSIGATSVTTTPLVA